MKKHQLINTLNDKTNDVEPNNKNDKETSNEARKIDKPMISA